MANRKFLPLRPEWTFFDAATAIWGQYRGGGLDVRGRVLSQLRQWAAMVGRKRAVASLEEFVLNSGTEKQAAANLGVAITTLRKLKKDFLSMEGEPLVPMPAVTVKVGDKLQGDVGVYTIQSELGRGGLGIVYRASCAAGLPDVAVKLLASTRFAIDDAVLRRFMREGQLARSFDNPNLVRSFDIGKYQDTWFLVMELLSGEMLYDRLRRHGPSPFPDAIKVTMGVVNGLAYLHEREILHRDISARNVLFRTDGTAALCDFGIARHVNDATLTMGQVQMGSLIYISSQQREDPHSATFEDDVFALGQLIFHVATGKVPHNAGSLSGHTHLMGSKAEVLIERMRSYERHKRPRNAVEVQEQLKDIWP